MSSSEDEDPFAAPGVIKQRRHVTADDVSSDDDCGTNALLKSGKEKKEALKEKERLTSLKSQAVGTKPLDALNVDEAGGEDVPDVTEQFTDQGGGSAEQPSPKRPRRGGKGKAAEQPSGKASAKKPEDDPSPKLSARDKALMAERNKQASELAGMRSIFSQLDENDDDDDDDDDDGSAGKRRASGGGKRRGGKAQGASSSGAAAGRGGSSGTGAGSSSSAPPPQQHKAKIWVKAYCNAVPEGEVIALLKDQPLSASNAVAAVANLLALDPARAKLFHTAVEEGGAVGMGEELDLARTPQELGLMPRSADGSLAGIWADEPAVSTMCIQLRAASSKGRQQTVEMRVAPGTTFSELLERYCAEHGEGKIKPEQLRLSFDGEDLEPDMTPAQADIEDGDLIDMVARS